MQDNMCICIYVRECIQHVCYIANEITVTPLPQKWNRNRYNDYQLQNTSPYVIHCVFSARLSCDILSSHCHDSFLMCVHLSGPLRIQFPIYYSNL